MRGTVKAMIFRVTVIRQLEGRRTRKFRVPGEHNKQKGEKS
jgi:hypothetical protein